MRTLILILAILALHFSLKAQPDTTIVNREFEELIEMYHSDDSVKTIEIEVAEQEGDTTIITGSDTVQIRVGKRNIEIITDNKKKTQIDVEKIEDFDSRWENKSKNNKDYQRGKVNRRKKLDGHWAGFEFGGNQLLVTGTSYANYPEGTPKFLETSPEKSFEFNFNFAEYSFGFGSYVGIVTGLGLNFNDYKFKNRYTIVKDETGVVQPVALAQTNFRLSKLSTTYLTAPLMLEIQIPGNHGQDRMFIAGGLIGGLKLGDHTKTRVGDEKLKDKGDHGISPLRWGYTARVGFENMGVYATYYNTELFETGKGPSTTPITIGLTFTF